MLIYLMLQTSHCPYHIAIRRKLFMQRYHNSHLSNPIYLIDNVYSCKVLILISHLHVCVYIYIYILIGHLYFLT